MSEASTRARTVADPFVSVALALSLLCAALLVVQRTGRAGDPVPVGRYRIARVEPTNFAIHPLLYLDSAEGEVWLMRNYRTKHPTLIPFELVPHAVAMQKRARPEPTSDQENLVASAQFAPSAMVRAWAADQLGLGPYPIEEVVAALIVAIADEDDHVAELAALSLSRKPHPKAIPALRKALEHEDPRVVANAQKALSQLE